MTVNATLRQFRYLVALADTLNFSRAAAACHVSQPSLSAQIQQLETALGASLVERTKHRVLLTRAGEEAVRRARDILARVEDLGRAMQAVGSPLAGPLRLGVIPTCGPYFLPRVLPSLREAYPELKLYLREDFTERLLDRLRGGELDAALLALPLPESGLDCEPIFREPFLLAVPPGHRLAAKQQILESELTGQPLLLLEDGHCFREQALEVCRLSGAREDQGFAATSLATLAEMVAGRLGLTLLPALAAPVLAANGQIKVRPLVDPVPSRTMALVWRRGAPHEPDLRQLAGLLRDHLPDGVAAAR
ncbi:LysR substrate-binding domain-containing protein [Indioceanicola profundi]|uniref:LysR substrate-binding domain-containing protein n=1 Tax=Indioceanicola profundi TaxID=2220096 RepID=UPI000E6ACE39|nr:LysR substrate-binding domain-containing protein [Indioceanicola profundi]